MEKVGGPLGVAAIAVVAVLLVVLAILHFGFHVFRRRKGKGRAKSGIMSDSRVEVLETTVIDADRRLVLIRCDRIEHLIMIGGPADLVVENDVRKVRGPGRPPAKVPGIGDGEARRADTAAQPTARRGRSTRRCAAGAEGAGAAARAAPDAETRQRSAPRACRPAARARAPRALRSGDVPRAAPPPPKARGAGALPPQRPQPVDPKSSRRDAAAATPRRRRRPPHRVSRPAGRAAARAAARRRERPCRKAGEGERPRRAGAGPAGRADPLVGSRFDRERDRAGAPLRSADARRRPPGRREPPSAKAMIDSATDARRPRRPAGGGAGARGAIGQPARPAAGPEPTISASTASRDAAEAERAEAGRAPKERPGQARAARAAARRAPTPRARGGSAARAAAPSRAPRGSAGHQPELPPARIADQLEDEMARLLGELTSDTKGR